MFYSAGVGRTGTYIAMDYLIKQAEAEGQLDVYHCVEQLRQQKKHVIQTKVMYRFIIEQ